MDSSHPFYLTPYERERKPVELLEDVDIILNCPEEFKCSICWSLFREIHITKDCFHRFCRDCIITALRQGNKECTVCRAQLVSKRDLRPDPEFDAMLQIFFPDRENFDQKYQEKVERILSESFTALDLVPKAKSKRSKKAASIASSTATSSTVASSEEIELELIPRKDNSDNDPEVLTENVEIELKENRYLRVPKTTTIELLKCFFSQYPKWSQNSPDISGNSRINQYYIYSYCEEKNEFSRLPDHIKLLDIYKNQEQEPLVLYYQHVYDLYGDFVFGTE